MTDRVEQIRTEELPPLEAQMDEIRAEADENYNDVWDIPDKMEERYKSLKDQAKNLRGEIETLEHYIEEYGGDEFTIRELSVGGVGKIQDDVAEASNANFQGEGTPKGGYARNRTLEVALVDSPPRAPEPSDMADTVGDWLFDCIDEFNTTGQVSLGNSSLRADLMKSEN